jgi:hypothetical protein
MNVTSLVDSLIESVEESASLLYSSYGDEPNTGYGCSVYRPGGYSNILDHGESNLDQMLGRDLGAKVTSLFADRLSYTSRPNIFGGQDRDYNDGPRTRSVPNIFGGEDVKILK